ncbi:Fur family transcriptional regulator [Phragmitibacter flavus]|nr:transcriptional repressor [Phragmitibacter flavus]
MSSARASKMLHDTVARCRELGLRRTWALEELLKRLIANSKPQTLADLAEAPELKDRCDKATIFRLLVRLEKHGILRRLGLHDRSAYYTLIEPGEHSDYLICTQCGVIETLDIACPVEALEARISKESGFKKLYHELEFFGVCPKCL